MTDRNVLRTSGAQDRRMMTRQSFMGVATAISVVSGVLALVAPVPMWSLFGSSVSVWLRSTERTAR
jgi:hypothetical protein